ncbi:MAG: cation-transporting P-type ATPase [Spirochaetaceae bacterium]|nr:MAG: cation-transporting P-type ATPase [Spirochaetaceae bacterium]
MNTVWHTQNIDAIIENLESDRESGVSQKVAETRLEEFGLNRLPDKQKRGPLSRFFSQFHNVLIYLLIAAAVIAGFLGEWMEAIVILTVVLINVTVSFIQEGKAEKALESIKGMLSLEANVIRDGERETVDAEQLVPGDLVNIKSGDRIPADIRFIRVKSLRIEEAALTGESEGVEKQTDPVDEDAALGDRTCLGFSGTTVTYGEAQGIVVATGADTEIGKINTMISEAAERTTPLIQKIDRFGTILSVVILALAGGFFAFGYLVQDFALEEMFLAAISIVVASIPEGLPAILTITLALGVQRMARRNAIIRKLPAVETLGSVSVICSDKTGTLTRNEMTVVTVQTAGGEFDVSGTGYEPKGRIAPSNQDGASDSDADTQLPAAVSELLRCGKACNDSSITQNEEDAWEVDGAPTEGALITLAHKGSLGDWEPERRDSVPFESEHKYMATLNKTEDGTKIYLKGAPERILERCSQQMDESGTSDLDIDAWKKRVDEVAGRGERVLALAVREESSSTGSIEHEDLKEGFTFLGLVGIIDPPRDEVVQAITECHEAGIRVIMITGDHSITAGAIAEKLGIESEVEPVVGASIESMDDDDLLKAVQNHSVFARTSPEHKLRLVKALQEHGNLVAMTGDGVNDAPALKNSDIGIAMGIKGTEVTKEAAEMVLADDNFATIVHAVEEGRTIYDNIRKTILYLLPANGAEAAVIIVALLLGLTLPISPVQILWVNMVSAVTLALALTVEPMERKVMQRPPRAPDEPILGAGFFRRVVFVSIISGGLTFAAFALLYESGMEGTDLAVARTTAVNMLVVAHTFYLFTCRKLYESSISRRLFENRLALGLTGVLILLQLGFTYLPFMNTLFGTAPVPAAYWALIAAAGLGAFLLIELEKGISRAFGSN